MSKVSGTNGTAAGFFLLVSARFNPIGPMADLFTSRRSHAELNQFWGQDDCEGASLGSALFFSFCLIEQGQEKGTGQINSKQ